MAYIFSVNFVRLTAVRNQLLQITARFIVGQITARFIVGQITDERIDVEWTF